ncbi:hypothetical protein M6B38_260805 [Iris pallida]|uniref:Uncharacterized protein n=1 Tax=Iris pallida TaxID=29817 RepID=A0AAX6IDK8_IRIPA|nr:hypothetical protein M6B38_170370 [Iris pallida]KAJ6851158.1 hypothetical protein M6B38_260805 [Iris pallida]
MGRLFFDYDSSWVDSQIYYLPSITLSKASVLAGYHSTLWARAQDISLRLQRMRRRPGRIPSTGQL